MKILRSRLLDNEIQQKNKERSEQENPSGLEIDQKE